MSHVAPGHSNLRSSRLSRLTAAVRRSMTEARYVDRRLMEMRTDLSRHSG